MPEAMSRCVSLMCPGSELTSVVLLAPCWGPQSGPTPEAMLVLEGQTAAWAIQTWETWVATWSHDIFWNQSIAKGHVWVHIPAAGSVLSMAVVTTEGWADAQCLGCHLGTCWHLKTMLHLGPCHWGHCHLQCQLGPWWHLDLDAAKDHAWIYRSIAAWVWGSELPPVARLLSEDFVTLGPKQTWVTSMPPGGQ